MQRIMRNNLKSQEVFSEKMMRSYGIFFFIISSIFWLLISLLFGVCTFLKMNFPDLSLFLSVGKLYFLHWHTLIYGWGIPIGFALLLWYVSRELEEEFPISGHLIHVAGIAWNLSVLFSCFFVGNSWFSLPSGILVTFLLLSLFLLFPILHLLLFSNKGRYFSINPYFFLPIFSYFWIFSIYLVFRNGENVHPLMQTALLSWSRWSFVYAFFISITFFFLGYFSHQFEMPRSKQNYSLISFLLLSFFSFFGGMQSMNGSPFPTFLSHISMISMIFLSIPLILEGGNFFTSLMKKEAFQENIPLRFFCVSALCLMVLGFTNLIISIPSFWSLLQFTLFHYGYFLFIFYGVFGMAAFGVIYFLVPTLFQKQWISLKMVRLHFWISVHSLFFFFVFSSLLGGSQQGSAQADWQNIWLSVVNTSFPYIMGLSTCLFLLFLSNFVFFIHLLALYFKGEGVAALYLKHGKHLSPHGEEGFGEN